MKECTVSCSESGQADVCMLLLVPGGLHLKSAWFCFLLLARHGLALFKFLAVNIIWLLCMVPFCARPCVG